MVIQLLILVAIIIATCVLLNNASFRIGVPVLLGFILLGIVFCNNGLMPVNFQRHEVENICTVALIFIMFYGGFGTRWEAARPIAAEATLLATLGVFVTAGLTGVFCRCCLRWGWVEALLMGAVISSTDAASVFSILRARKLGLKNRTAPLLEMESGSNDPCSYTLTIVMLAFLEGKAGTGNILWTLFSQLAFGAIFGIVISFGAVFLMRRIKFATSGFDSLFVVAIALFSYALPSLIGGNGYLSAYIVGIVLGNTDFPGKRELVHFFDGITGLMQVVIFFMLGLLAKPAELQNCILPAIAIFLVLLFIVRPVALAMILVPFRKYSFKQQVLLSFSGLRGAASIVFAIIATSGETALENDIFNIVFCIVLISIALQGSFLPLVAKGLDMVDADEDIMKTFSDFSQDVDIQFAKIDVTSDNTWKDKRVADLKLPHDILLCMIKRDDGKSVVPNGNTVIKEGDTVLTCTRAFDEKGTINIWRHTLHERSKWIGHSIAEYRKANPDDHSQLLMITRGDETIIPHGNTVLAAGDVLYINKVEKATSQQ